MQTDRWSITLQSALAPHDPGQGSTHFSLWHAKLFGHSELIVHSGRQFGGRPRYWGKHEQAGELPTTRHWEFGPHGDGTHGFCGVSITTGFSII